jgi:hypothetical protein
MSATRPILFHTAAAPYVAGDIAGFPPAQAQAFVDRGIATFHTFPSANADEDEALDDAFAVMDRASLIAYGKEKLGMTDEPAADVSDDQLRDAIRAATAKAGKKGGRAR